jgi:hypothetical protein
MLTLVFAARSALRVAFRYKGRHLEQKEIRPDRKGLEIRRSIRPTRIQTHLLMSFAHDDRFGSAISIFPKAHLHTRAEIATSHGRLERLEYLLI